RNGFDHLRQTIDQRRNALDIRQPFAGPIRIGPTLRERLLRLAVLEDECPGALPGLEPILDEEERAVRVVMLEALDENLLRAACVVCVTASAIGFRQRTSERDHGVGEIAAV